MGLKEMKMKRYRYISPGDKATIITVVFVAVILIGLAVYFTWRYL